MILRRGISGELGSDLRAAADEILLADGLAVGEGAISERGGSTEWDLPAIEAGHGDEEIVITAGNELMVDEPDTGTEAEAGTSEELEMEREIVVRRVSRTRDEEIRSEQPVEASVAAAPENPEAPRGWLDEVEPGETMDFPKRSTALEELSRPPMDREEVRARVEYLFPRTETDWAVGQSNQPRRNAPPGRMSA